MGSGRNTVIMAPDEVPVTNTLAGSALYLASVYVTMLAMELLSPPPPCVSADFELTSQQVPSYGDEGKMTMKPFWSASCA